MWYGFRGTASGELISFGGRVIVHDNPDEAGWLLANVVPVPLSLDFPLDTMKLQDHPHLEAVQWPLDRRAFR